MVTLDAADTFIAGDRNAYDELTERGWLLSQGFGRMGTGRGAPNRASNRSYRRGTQASRSASFGGSYVPDASIAGMSTGMTHNRADTANAPATRTRFTPLTTAAIDTAMYAAVSQPAAAVPVNDAERTKTFGIELEFIGNASEVLRQCRIAGLTVRDERNAYNHSTVSYWKIVPDGSLSHGAELVSPILRGNDGFRQLKAAFIALNAAGATFTRETGMHVHHGGKLSGVTRQNAADIAIAYNEAQSLIDAIMPYHRTTYNTYCQPRDAYTINQYLASGTFHFFPRYSHVNLSAYDYVTHNNAGRGEERSTLEFRQHNGTQHYQAAANWVRFGQCLIAAVCSGYAIDTAHGLSEFLASIDCEPRTIEYYVRRSGIVRRARARQGYSVR